MTFLSFFLSVSKVCATRNFVHAGVSVQGVYVRGVYVLGGICLGGKCPGGMCPRVSVRG